MQGYQSESLDKLLTAVSLIDNVDDAKKLFEDLFTIKELQDMAQRFETAILLSEGKNYLNIAAEVGTSTATISRVKKCLDYGAGGYAKALEILGENTNDN